MRRLLLLGTVSALSAVPAAQPSAGPDLLLVNGRVYTVDAARPWAEALAVRGDRLAAVGTTAEIRGLAGPRTRTIDSFEEDLKGTIAAGKLADLSVFDTKLVEVGRSRQAALLEARALYTIVGGTIVHDAKGPSTAPAVR